ncbi:bacillithiol system redox-active protein YtxJ [Neobacillus piezotolerans]|uniref:Bacillithiol system redox-active protein YtxJ n=2 Tax=Neobacillus piezotolerans TaxID=2259171 RepID=A0A3D8GNU8_9BACI|nr:bacillithiol system redox-active protein YtxJ [Neobacillus piezotolerans]RDU36174.1 bacillithiol system redox-active protein YtxJ [Neobacillus piezotolerans]
MINTLESIEQLEEILQKESKVMVLKHSSTCPISHAAFEEYGEFAGQDEVPAWMLIVQESRPLSNYIAETYGIKHESPQAILFQDGKPIWNASHWKITKRSLTEASTNA